MSISKSFCHSLCSLPSCVHLVQLAWSEGLQSSGCSSASGNPSAGNCSDIDSLHVWPMQESLVAKPSCEVLNGEYEVQRLVIIDTMGQFWILQNKECQMGQKWSINYVKLVLKWVKLSLKWSSCSTLHNRPANGPWFSVGRICGAICCYRTVCVYDNM
jgi:hypothetical protein